MSRSTFWPLYFIVAALGASAVWRFAPDAREVLPPSVANAITDAAKRVTGRKPLFDEKEEDHGFALPAMVGRDNLGERVRPIESAANAANDSAASQLLTSDSTASHEPRTTNHEPLPSSSAFAAEDKRAASREPSSSAVASEDKRSANHETRTTNHEPLPSSEYAPISERGKRKPQPKRDAIAEQEKEAKTMPAPSFADKDVDPSELPAFRGVQPADPKTANWGVTARTTEIEGFLHKDLGNVGGGRFFLIERKMRREEGLTLVGNFTPKRLPQAVMLPAENLYCFSGSPEDLTDNQRKCLRRYYELRAEALDLKYKIEHPRYDDNGRVLNRGAKASDNASYRAMLDEMKRVAGPIRGLAF